MRRDESDTPNATLAAYADGTLPAVRRTGLETRIARSPELAARLREQRAALDAIAVTHEVVAPAGLRARVDAEYRHAADQRGRRDRRSRWTRPRWVAAGGALAAATAVIVVVVLVSPGGTPGAPSIAEAARLGTLPPTGAAPGPDPRAPKLLTTAQSGVAFPNWLEKFGWTATGTRTDTLGDRTTTTVFYARATGRLAYTIVSGAALHVPGTARSTSVAGVDLSVLRTAPPAITWTRSGHTCVLTSTGARAPAAKILELAAWNGKGAIPF